jgi:hypothetical protein
MERQNFGLASPNMPARESTTSLLGFSIIICYDSLWHAILAWIHMIASTEHYEIGIRTQGDASTAWTDGRLLERLGHMMLCHSSFQDENSGPNRNSGLGEYGTSRS